LAYSDLSTQVIHDFLPSLLLNVSWENATANLGNTIVPDEVQEEPVIELLSDQTLLPHSAVGTQVQYTITLTDPDAPSRDNPEWSEMCHWIATDLAMPAFALLRKKQNPVMPWKPPGPPPKTGKHRYIFLVFAPANSTTEKLNLTTPQDRQHWGTGKERHGVRDWARQNGLVAVAANFFYSQNKEQ
jgi:phosphatidylethanolamine-binding protein